MTLFTGVDITVRITILPVLDQWGVWCRIPHLINYFLSIKIKTNTTCFEDLLVQVIGNKRKDYTRLNLWHHGWRRWWVSATLQVCFPERRDQGGCVSLSVGCMAGPLRCQCSALLWILKVCCHSYRIIIIIIILWIFLDSGFCALGNIHALFLNAVL